MKKIKLLHIQVLPILTGVQRVSINILQNLDRNKYECWMLCAPNLTDRADSMISELEKIGVKVITVPSLKREIGFLDFRAFWEIYKLCRQEKFDVIHAQTSKGGFLGRIAGKLAGCKKVLYTVQNVPFHKYQNVLKRIFYLILEIIVGFFCDKLILVNKAYRTLFWFIPDRRLVTIYNSADFSKLKFKEARNDNKVRIISIGRLDRQKSPLVLLEALKIVIDTEKNIEALIAGEGEYYEQAKNFVKDNGLDEYIKLLGWCSAEQVADLLSKSDIFCSSPIYEAFGIVFCEAGFTGLPCISTNVDAIPEVIRQNKTGLLVPPNNPKAFAEAILELVNDKDKMVTMGMAAREVIKANFSNEKMVESYIRLYEG